MSDFAFRLLLTGTILTLAALMVGTCADEHPSSQRWAWRAMAVSGGLVIGAALLLVWSA